MTFSVKYLWTLTCCLPQMKLQWLMSTPKYCLSALDLADLVKLISLPSSFIMDHYKKMWFFFFFFLKSKCHNLAEQHLLKEYLCSQIKKMSSICELKWSNNVWYDCVWMWIVINIYHVVIGVYCTMGLFLMFSFSKKNRKWKEDRYIHKMKIYCIFCFSLTIFIYCYTVLIKSNISAKNIHGWKCCEKVAILQNLYQTAMILNMSMCSLCKDFKAIFCFLSSHALWSCTQNECSVCINLCPF